MAYSLAILVMIQKGMGVYIFFIDIQEEYEEWIAEEKINESI